MAGGDLQRATLRGTCVRTKPPCSFVASRVYTGFGAGEMRPVAGGTFRLFAYRGGGGGGGPRRNSRRVGETKVSPVSPRTCPCTLMHLRAKYLCQQAYGYW